MDETIIVNKILKLKKDMNVLNKIVKQSVYLYNNVRPHLNLNM